MIANIERYISFEVLRPLFVVLLILTALFACFSSARYLAEAVTETLGVYYMLELIFLKTFISLEVLAPVALYAAVVIGLGRLHRDQEILAMQAAGMGRRHIIRSILLVSIPVAILVGLLSVLGRPWAYQRSYQLDARANADLNTDRFQAGRFYGNEDSARVVYIGSKDAKTGEMGKIFHYVRRDGNSEITIAGQGNQTENAPPVPLELNLFDGYLYRLKHADAVDEVVRYVKLVKIPGDPEEAIGYKRKAATINALGQSKAPPDIAELQWRLSRPLATILLALIAIPLSRNSPRQGKNESVFIAALVFAVYYNLSGVARSWVEQGVVGEFPGIWWLHGLMLLGVISTLWPRRSNRLRR
ncbi:MAG: LPS export ABC transporter permease LptF [Gammaproteobacteria bacterium]